MIRNKTRYDTVEISRNYICIDLFKLYCRGVAYSMMKKWSVNYV